MRNAKGGKNMANPMYEVRANDAASEASVAQFNIDRTYPGRWTITFSNPPINMFVPTTIVELGALMTDLEADPSVKVVVFQSANPDFFIAHLDVAKAAERPEALGLWRAAGGHAHCEMPRIWHKRGRRTRFRARFSREIRSLHWRRRSPKSSKLIAAEPPGRRTSLREAMRVSARTTIR